MIVRCGACQTQFDVPGPGTFGCPACGTANAVRAAAPAGAGGFAAPPPAQPAAPETPSPRVGCPECEFEFIVGDIAVATCPNCSAAVAVAPATEEDE